MRKMSVSSGKDRWISTLNVVWSKSCVLYRLLVERLLQAGMEMYVYGLNNEHRYYIHTPISYAKFFAIYTTRTLFCHGLDRRQFGKRRVVRLAVYYDPDVAVGCDTRDESLLRNKSG